MDLSAVREASLRELAGIGICPPPHFPLLDQPHLKSSEEASDRLFCLTAAAAVAYGFPRERALKWLKQEGLWAKLEEDELQFLVSSRADPALFQWQVQGIFVLSWALGILEAINLWGPCPDDLVFKLPDLKTAASTASFREQHELRSVTEIVAVADLAYCMHWGVRDARLNGKPPPRDVEELEIGERRRALDWLIDGEGWYAISLDT